MNIHQPANRTRCESPLTLKAHCRPHATPSGETELRCIDETSLLDHLKGVIGIRPLCTAAILLAGSARLFGVEIEVQFSILESSRTNSIAYSTGDSSEQDIRQSGVMDAILSFDPATQRPVAIRFTGGSIHETPWTLKNTAKISFDGFGVKQVSVEQSSSGLELEVTTIGAPQSIDTDGRLLDLYRLRSFPLSGRLTAKLTIDGQTQTQTIDVATNPPDYVEPPYSADIRLQVVELRNVGSTSDYQITFHSSVNNKLTEKMPNTDTTVTRSTSGSTIATAEFSAPNAFGQWLWDNGYSLDDDRASNRNGVPLAVLFAFNRAAADARSLPWSFSTENGSLILTLQLPESGIAKALRVERRDDLSTGVWQALTEADFLENDSSLDSGASGARRIQFSGSGSRFYRVVPDDERISN
ncbi:hypothetical protein [Pelagicoccus sp. SDUM812003]|uniref:hypothetical protein n=1 Tax=Pelagicoccus sp. SDUM812003 TaxID=3041267 RepID=UPI00280EF5F4|nr:hypothetical protein [Pelagicoccus sp. SDUM812003]MDQ8204699.1 hypothetical protein [Pelagicoccus sp. SDUM812003]